MPLYRPKLLVTSPEELVASTANLSISHWFDASSDAHFSGAILKDRRDEPVGGQTNFPYFQRADNLAFEKAKLNGLTALAFGSGSTNRVAELRNVGGGYATLPSAPFMILSVVQCWQPGTFFSESLSATQSSRFFQAYRNTINSVGQAITSVVWRGSLHDIYEDSVSDPTSAFCLTVAPDPASSKITLSANGRFVSWSNTGTATESARFVLGGRPNGTLGTYTSGLVGHIAELIVLTGAGLEQFKLFPSNLQLLKHYLIKKWNLAEAIYQRLSPEICPDVTANVRMDGWQEGSRVLSAVNSNQWVYGDESIVRENSASVWQFKNNNTVLASSFSNATYPWQAIWPTPFTAAKQCP